MNSDRNHIALRTSKHCSCWTKNLLFVMLSNTNYDKENLCTVHVCEGLQCSTSSLEMDKKA